jgi:hypothetical protein
MTIHTFDEVFERLKSFIITAHKKVFVAGYARESLKGSLRLPVKRAGISPKKP